LNDQRAGRALLFVCLGNICRSPTAEGVMRELLVEAGIEGVLVDSAGTAGWHAGDAPDRRSVAEARCRGIDLTGLRGRQVGAADFDRFDLLLAMDAENERALLRLAPDAAARAKVTLLRSFDPTAVAAGDLDVPDPYYGGPDGFALVYDAIESACRRLLEQLDDLGAVDDGELDRRGGAAR
jgi:low molecular weight protein-tyrosine phosphatase